MTRPRMLQISIAVFLTTLALLMVEILLVRVLEVILVPNIGYAAITLAMFASGLSGVYATVKPLSTDEHIRDHVAILALLFAAAIVLIRPTLNATPLLYGFFPPGPAKQMVAAATMYVVLVVPFFLSGMILAHIFSAFPDKVRRLYFWDLAGAAAGCVVFIPFLRRFGPGGLMFWAAAASVLASALLAGRRRWVIISTVGAVALVLTPLLKSDGYFEFRMQAEKRGVRDAQLAGLIEFSEWGPISKIDVIRAPGVQVSSGTDSSKHVAYDGGSQSSDLFYFDGNVDGLREMVLAGYPRLNRHFWIRGVLASHYFKRDSGAEVLIVGSAAGQETKAALLFNPSRVDGVELVDTVVRLGRENYADFIGNIFKDPRVHNRVGEGRSYLRTTDKKYDIVQIFSNHTSSSIASGTGATTPVYLQTVEAYREYFSHLKDHGILHINHHFYPRMVTTAARAWKNMGRTGFQSHVLVFQRPGEDTLPTMLIKASPWSQGEVDELSAFFDISDGDAPRARRVVDPLHPDATFLSPEFFDGGLSAALLNRIDYQVRPSTDDWPYFNNIQNGFERVAPNRERFVDEAMAGSINGRLAWPLGEYSIFAAIGLVAVVLSAVTVFAPLVLSTTGQNQWQAKYLSLAYFASLGAGFIIIELVLIQIFMKLIGFPLYAFSVVICTMLAAAGLGSMAADRFGISPARRWVIPFAGILACGAALAWTYPLFFDRFLAVSTWQRISASIVMIFPLAFFLGMPFPLGVLSLHNEPRGLIAWAWGTNALFTVAGGVTAGVLSMFVGFRMTLLIALGIYVIAFGLFARLRAVERVSVQSVDAV
jgi:spermidine synthase